MIDRLTVENIGVAQDVVEEGVAEEREDFLSRETDGHQVLQLDAIDRLYDGVHSANRLFGFLGAFVLSFSRFGFSP